MSDIVLPWPARELHPNARPHFHAKARAAKAYREQAHWITVAAEVNPPAEGEILLDVRFYPPDRRRRDVDGMLASIKSAIDGIADALEVNDQRFAFIIRRCEPSKNGAVFVTVQEAA